MLPKPIGITVMHSMYMPRYGITGVAMQFRKAKPTPIRWKVTMRNSGTIWHAWLALLVAFHAVLMLCTVQSVYLSITSTNVNWENISSQNIPSTSLTSFTHPFRHSRIIDFLTTFIFISTSDIFLSYLVLVYLFFQKHIFYLKIASIETLMGSILTITRVSFSFCSGG